MAYQRDDAPTLGSWYNNWGDLWGDIKQGVAAVTGGSSHPPGWGATLPTYTTQALYDDLALIQQWKDACTANAGVPGRIPLGPSAGELGCRWTGPGTDFPNATRPDRSTGRYSWTLAPANVIAADHRGSAANTAAVDAVVPRTSDPDGIVSLPSLDWKKYALWGALIVGGVIVLPPLLSAVTASGARRR